MTVAMFKSIFVSVGLCDCVRVLCVHSRNYAQERTTIFHQCSEVCCNVTQLQRNPHCSPQLPPPLRAAGNTLLGARKWEYLEDCSKMWTLRWQVLVGRFSQAEGLSLLAAVIHWGCGQMKDGTEVPSPMVYRSTLCVQCPLEEGISYLRVICKCQGVSHTHTRCSALDTCMLYPTSPQALHCQRVCSNEYNLPYQSLV